MIVNHNNLPEGVQGLYQLFAELKEFRAFVESSITNCSNAPPPDDWLTKPQVAKLLGVSLPTILKWTKSGQLKGYRIDRRVRYRRSEIDSALKPIVTQLNKR
ncbi:helix-turn-helix domain-containing protein [Flavisolibacter ginsengisoli]|jgi:excisionase family DNA binding protein|uniref:Transcriptional regulator, AlpA family n=1 Tax=Flavisolibacter ginsengisoli DSM 18119 TaxID=1121884 RepID=A0A1M5CGJ2_9BACT|nr:transcriptional regulator, AlpA family [Flavisolibacter ginsengisoli DSM 18119]